ncbi:MAG: hypothetical protein AB7T37_06425 [Dehalococcoidia bacterium]
MPTKNDTADCVHHWILGRPAGGMVSARCKRCGGSRTYQDDIGRGPWTHRAAARGRRAAGNKAQV